jgi:REP element-mobilizing transposase RayT
MEQHQSKLPSRRSIRLRDYDYSLCGMYFVTICAHGSECLFGRVEEGKMHKNPMGVLVEEAWEAMFDYFPHAESNLFVVMPNHVHGMIDIHSEVDVAKSSFGTSKTVGSMVRAFKSKVTMWARRNTEIKNVWQRNYYEHVVRDERDYNRIYEYILNNPEGWVKDGTYPNYVIR